LSEEQIRQLTVLITGGDLDADPLHQGGFWQEAIDHADELDAEATEHAELQMSSGSLNSSETTITVSNASRLAVGQFVRIDEERLEIVEIPTTGQVLIGDVGRTPDELLVSGSDGFEIGDLIRVGAELMEVTGIRADGDLEISLDASTGAGADVISVDNPAFFGQGYTVHAGSEQIEILSAVETGQVLAIATGRAQSTISVSGSAGFEVGMRIRMGEELLEVLSIEPATVTIERGSSDVDGNSTTAASHTSGASILKLVEEPAEDEEPEDPDTGQTLLGGLDANGTTITVSGTTGIGVGETYQIGNELVLVTVAEPAILSVARGVGGTERGEHSRRITIFEDNFLNVERGVLGTSAASQDAGTSLLFDVLEVERAVEDTTLENHTKNAEIFLGHVIVVERGAFDTEPAEHENDTLVLDFPPPPDAPATTGAVCGQNPPLIVDNGGDDGDELRGPPATEVGISLVEFDVIPSVTSAPAEQIDFNVVNDGTTVHNFRAVQTDLAPDNLPVDGQAVDESQFDDIEGFAGALRGGEGKIDNADLAAGSYVLFCNVPGHYSEGMFVGFEVTP
jgi:hypothetical protein